MIQISPILALLLFLGVIILFFWGIIKAIKTQKKIYALAMLPFVILLFMMFFIGEF